MYGRGGAAEGTGLGNIATRFYSPGAAAALEKGTAKTEQGRHFDFRVAEVVLEEAGREERPSRRAALPPRARLVRGASPAAAGTRRGRKRGRRSPGRPRRRRPRSRPRSAGCCCGGGERANGARRDPGRAGSRANQVRAQAEDRIVRHDPRSRARHRDPVPVGPVREVRDRADPLRGSRAERGRTRRGGPAPGAGGRADAGPSVRQQGRENPDVGAAGVRQEHGGERDDAREAQRPPGAALLEGQSEQQARRHHGQPRKRHVVGERRADPVVQGVAAVPELPDPDQRQRASRRRERQKRPARPRRRVGEVHRDWHEKQEREAGKMPRADGRIAGEDGGQQRPGPPGRRRGRRRASADGREPAARGRAPPSRRQEQEPRRVGGRDLRR